MIGKAGKWLMAPSRAKCCHRAELCPLISVWPRCQKGQGIPCLPRQAPKWEKRFVLIYSMARESDGRGGEGKEVEDN